MDKTRRHLRYVFSATAEMTGQNRGTRIGRVKQLSAGGAYVALLEPFSKDASLQLTIYKDELVFRCDATVIHRTDGIGMGLAFRNVLPESGAVLKRWLKEAELAGASARRS